MTILPPLIDDEFVDTPKQRIIKDLVTLQDSGKPVVGAYCCYAPMELVWAMGAGVANLCAFSNKPISAAETVLPASLCPLIKSSYGFIITDECPFFILSDAIIAETTCDGKKKMFELICERKPMVTLDLPQMPDEEEADAHWEAQVRKLRAFLERTFSTRITDEQLRRAIRDANKRRSLLIDIAKYAAFSPPYINWSELNQVVGYGHFLAGDAVVTLLEDVLRKLESRRLEGLTTAAESAPRVLVTGCPLGGDTEKIFRVVEEAGGVVVAQEACSGIKPLLNPIEEDSHDPIAAIANRYLQLPCSCMTPNSRRLRTIDWLIAEFKPDVVIDAILLGCHTYNVESMAIRDHVTQKHGLPFLKIETDYSESDAAQLTTRVEALLEIAR